ncbi:trimethyllysine dioxygenase, mitochondrial isoform X1 [Diaphorina citri]|uniref:Trimethyllysine dioxygenase, mitochondrial isoform X1 n=1 Tax=Diaphorina citri TaxID=121845 RepID=A0A3Q0IQW4_DIACI|nr:trimethyllysine dioxygenase, mitochondrial isoform X1 [Diaphorina citri]
MGYNVILRNSDQVLHVKSELPGPGEDDFQVSLLWLRDNCRCSECYNEETRQRKFLVTDLNLNVTARYVTLQQDLITVLWDDDHKSTYNLTDLVSNLRPAATQPEPVLWSADTIGSLLSRHSATEVMKESGQKRLLHDIFTYGLGIVTGVDPTVEATRSLVTSICPHIRHNLFGTKVR